MIYRRASLFTVLLCAFGSVAAALIALLTESNAPGWAHELFLIVLLCNAAVIGFGWRSGWRWDLGLGAVVVGVGMLNIAVWVLLGTFSVFNGGTSFWPLFFLAGDYSIGITRPILYLVVPGVIMSAIGSWFVTLSDWRITLSSNRRITAALIALILAGILLIETTIGLAIVLLLWAQGIGLYLIPAVVIAGIRWSRPVTPARVLLIGGLVGVLVVTFLLPRWIFTDGTTLLGCPGERWADQLQYSIDWMRTDREIRWSDGCNNRWLRLSH